MLKFSQQPTVAQVSRRPSRGLHRRNPTAVRHRCAERKRAQRCGSKNEHSVVTAMLLIVMLQHRDSDSAKTTVVMTHDDNNDDSAEITMCTLVLSVATIFTLMCTLLSHQCAHRCHRAVRFTSVTDSQRY